MLVAYTFLKTRHLPKDQVSSILSFPMLKTSLFVVPGWIIVCKILLCIIGKHLCARYITSLSIDVYIVFTLSNNELLQYNFFTSIPWV